MILTQLLVKGHSLRATWSPHLYCCWCPLVCAKLLPWISLEPCWLPSRSGLNVLFLLPVSLSLGNHATKSDTPCDNRSPIFFLTFSSSQGSEPISETRTMCPWTQCPIRPLLKLLPSSFSQKLPYYLRQSSSQWAHQQTNVTFFFFFWIQTGTLTLANISPLW